MEQKQLLQNLLIANTEKLTRVIARFNFESFNHKPDEGRWSAGEIAEHILIFDIRLNTILEEATTAPGRNPDAQIITISDRLENLADKIEAPPFLKPSGMAKRPDAIIKRIRAERRKVARVIEEKDITLLNAVTPHRFFGTLTALEWIVLVIKHTDRHLLQLKQLS